MHCSAAMLRNIRVFTSSDYINQSTLQEVKNKDSEIKELTDLIIKLKMELNENKYTILRLTNDNNLLRAEENKWRKLIKK